MEVKKDSASIDDIEQLMKYVDWVKNEYAYGDYSLIKAYLVAHDFSSDVIQKHKEIGKRIYTIGSRPPKTLVWNNLTLVRYHLSLTSNQDVCVKFSKVVK